MKRCLCGQVMAQACVGSTCHGCLTTKARARKAAQRLLPRGARCYCCDAPATTMDHEIPLSMVTINMNDGRWVHDGCVERHVTRIEMTRCVPTLAPMCKPCNNSKYNRDRCYLEHGTAA